MGVIEASDEGTTTSLSKTSIEKVVIAALLDGRRISVCGAAGSRFDIAADSLQTSTYLYLRTTPCVYLPTHNNNTDSNASFIDSFIFNMFIDSSCTLPATKKTENKKVKGKNK